MVSPLLGFVPRQGFSEYSSSTAEVRPPAGLAKNMRQSFTLCTACCSIDTMCPAFWTTVRR